MTQRVQLGGCTYSRGELSRGTGISLSHISRIFSGKRAPSMKAIEKIAEYTGLSKSAVMMYLPLSTSSITSTKEGAPST